MFSILFAALCAAVTLADSSAINSYPPVAGAVREYEYANAYMQGSKPTYEYVAAASSPYSKSDTRYMADSSSDSTSSSSDSRPSYYKTKYGSESAVNAIRPSPYVSGTSTSGSATSGSSSSSAEQTSAQQQTYTGSEYLSNPSSQTTSAEYTTSTGGVAYTYGEREPANHHHAHHTYATTSQDTSADTQPQQYVRPATSSGTVYASYTAGSPGVDYGHRPGYSHGSISSPAASDYPSSVHSQPHYHLHPPHMSSSGSSSYPGYEENYPAPHSIQSQSSSPIGYKYIMTSSPSKYQTVLGAIKSLFGGGGSILSDASPSASHISPYPMSPSSYYSPLSSSMMHSPGHHPPTGMLTSSSAPLATVGTSSPGYYHSSSFQPYSKSYPPMRFVMGYGGSSSGPSPGNKIIVVRDSSGSLSSGYPSSLIGSSMLGSPSSYSPVKSKIYAPGPQTYLTSAPSSMGYISGPSSSGYSGYSSSGSFSGGHGGSTFLGYST